MAKSSGQFKGKSDRQRIIEWYKSDLERYRGMMGEYTEYNTLVTDDFIKKTEQRIEELEEKERKWNDTIRRLINQD